MTMHRRPVGRARMLAAAGSAITLVGCVLPWWTVGGGPNEITQMSGNAFDSSGILVFIAALAVIALVTLPYARERPVPADTWSSYAVIVGIATVAFLYRLVDLGLSHLLSFDAPGDVLTHISGLWITAIGLIVLGRSVYDMRRAPAER
jgi:amino acid transporter